MKKNFDKWNVEKKRLHEEGDRLFYHAREIWWCSVGVNIGNELDGTGERHDRPVLVVRPFNAETFFGVSLIGHERKGKYYFSVGTVGDRVAAANLSQARLFDAKRLIRKIGTLNEEIYRKLSKELVSVLFPFLKLK